MTWKEARGMPLLVCRCLTKEMQIYVMLEKAANVFTAEPHMHMARDHAVMRHGYEIRSNV